MFGREVTPNHHKLAEEFVLLDNLYCNGQVSRDGHPWSHDGLQHRLHRPRLAPDLLAPRKGVDDDDEGQPGEGPLGLHLGRLRPRRA